MNTTTNPEIIDEIKNLISHSVNEDNFENPDFQMMHRAIIKKYFDAKKVSINYKEATVDMKLPVGNKQYTNITFECQHLGRFLKSCIKKDEKSLFFYQNILSQFNVISAA
ncbi:hypothetical protein [Christiangramia salexigens]|uniref:Uncharacterized protein n=1 Tax=Christiangramia salexigens TaxID=1913577 RepID=A0A1L3J5L9_9FLAO|nr:hypothetical protein [Christiangramia salexigens]APG60416.1 hypothetical protein LPB144_08360 [Christiangramia salexigens]